MYTTLLGHLILGPMLILHTGKTLISYRLESQYIALNKKLRGYFEEGAAPPGSKPARRLGESVASASPLPPAPPSLCTFSSHYVVGLCTDGMPAEYRTSHEWPIMKRYHHLKLRVGNAMPPTPPDSIESDSVSPRPQVPIPRQDPAGVALSVFGYRGERGQEEEEDEDEDDEVVCTGVRLKGKAFNSIPGPGRTSAAAATALPSPPLPDPQPRGSTTLPVRIKAESPKMPTVQRVVQDMHTPAAPIAQASPTLLHTYAATARKRPRSVDTPRIKISESSRKFQRLNVGDQGARRMTASDSDSDSDHEGEGDGGGQSGPSRQTLPRQSMTGAGLISFTAAENLGVMFSDPNIRPQQPWRARLLGEAYAQVTPSRPSSKGKEKEMGPECPATGGSMDMDIIEDEDDAPNTQPSQSSGQPPASSNVHTPKRLDNLAFRPDTPPLPIGWSPATSRPDGAKIDDETNDTPLPPTAEIAEERAPVSFTLPAPAQHTVPQALVNVLATPPSKQASPDDSESALVHLSTWKVASSVIDLLLAQLRSATTPQTCLAGAHVFFTAGHIPFRPKLVELVPLLGGRSNSLDETYHPVTPGAPRSSGYFVYPIGWTPGATAKLIPGITQLDVLGFLALVQDKLSRQ